MTPTPLITVLILAAVSGALSWLCHLLLVRYRVHIRFAEWSFPKDKNHWPFTNRFQAQSFQSTCIELLLLGWKWALAIAAILCLISIPYRLVAGI